MDLAHIITLLVLGLASGVLGGLLGIGGSIIMIPVLTIAFGPNQHLYQAAAMIVNVFVAIPATIRHWRAGALRARIVSRMLPFGVVMILVGVAASNAMAPQVLQRIFGVFLIYVIIVNIQRLIQHAEEPAPADQRSTWPRLGFVASVMGFTAGLLGVGGGLITVPLLQRAANLPLRLSIAASSAVMCLTAIVGAARKNATIGLHENLQSLEHVPLEVADSFLLAGCLVPMAVIGGLIGAGLTHALPLRWIRVAFILLMVCGTLRMFGIL